jgi:hypothetical protein
MPVDLPSILDGIGFLGTVAVIFWLVVTGRLVPRKTHQDALDAAAKKDEHIAEMAEHLRLLAEVGRTVEQLARGLQQEMKP